MSSQFPNKFERSRFNFWSKLLGASTPITRRITTSSAFGEDEFFTFKTLPGRVEFDTLTYTKRNLKDMPNHKLGVVGTCLFGQGKLDLTPKELFAAFKREAEDRLRIGVYCIMVSGLRFRSGEPFLRSFLTLPTYLPTRRIPVWLYAFCGTRG